MNLQKIILLLLAVSLVFASSLAYAQVKLPDFEARLARAEKELKAVESRTSTLASRIQAKKLITDKDLDDPELGKAIFTYAATMKALYDEAMRAAELAGKTQGKEGSVKPLERFEATAKSHEAMLKGLEAKTKAIETGLKEGTIKLDKPVLQRASPAEIEEFKKFLAPAGLKEMERLHPDIFKPGVKPMSSLNPFDGILVAGALQGFCSSLIALPEQLSTFLVSPAEAAIAARCIPLALALKWAELVACAREAGPAAVEAYNSFKRCWECSSKPWWIPRVFWRAGCLAVFIGKLA